MGFYTDYAQKLKIKPVWQQSAANDTGFLTPPELYTPYRSFDEHVELIHATVGTNTLPYFAAQVDKDWNVTKQAGSIRDGRLVCAHQLIPKDDYTIYDLVPAGYGCGHCNPGKWRGYSTLNYQARGYEFENLQNGDSGDRFTEAQYIKGALSIAYHTAVKRIPNLNICSHWDASFGARNMDGHTDPNAGPFDWAVFYGHLWALRQERAVFDFWGVAPWDGR